VEIKTKKPQLMFNWGFFRSNASSNKVLNSLPNSFIASVLLCGCLFVKKLLFYHAISSSREVAGKEKLIAEFFYILVEKVISIPRGFGQSSHPCICSPFSVAPSSASAICHTFRLRQRA